MTPHEKLVEKVAKRVFFEQHSIMHDHAFHWSRANKAIWLSIATDVVRLILSELHNVTPEMFARWPFLTDAGKKQMVREFRAMLSASPLNPEGVK